VKLIVGLGNPGRNYAHTRHNVGFDVVDILARRYHTKVLGRQCRALVGCAKIGDENVLLVKPQTFMNDSGLAVGQIAGKHGIEPKDVTVIYDDIDLPLGRIRLRTKGSSGGHKGMKSIITHLQSEDFPRLRIGIGRQGDVVDHVLSRFNRQERAIIEVALERAADAVEALLKDGVQSAMNQFNKIENND
jgi:PTH1 family peptidyl-tRNA hydrolase